jgi:hypothetical protein
LFTASLKYKEVSNHNKYANNYDYYRAIYLLNQIEFKENNVMILKEDEAYASPVSVVFFEYYDKIQSVESKLKNDADHLQCIVSNPELIENSIPFGKKPKA